MRCLLKRREGLVNRGLKWKAPSKLLGSVVAKAYLVSSFTNSTFFLNGLRTLFLLLHNLPLKDDLSPLLLPEKHALILFSVIRDKVRELYLATLLPRGHPFERIGLDHAKDPKKSLS